MFKWPNVGEVVISPYYESLGVFLGLASLSPRGWVWGGVLVIR